jgi:antitoxin ParD1/3/4
MEGMMKGQEEFPMASTINLSLTEELRDFIDRHCGDGSEFATASEFVRDVIREKKRRIEAAALRDSVIEGYSDVAKGRFVEFSGSLKESIAEAKRRDKKGW